MFKTPFWDFQKSIASMRIFATLLMEMNFRRLFEENSNWLPYLWTIKTTYAGQIGDALKRG